MTKDEVIGLLNRLIETSLDGAQGFLSCAQEIEAPEELKSFFVAASQRCRNGAIELQDQVRRLGGDPKRTGSIAGAVHRTWIDIKAAFTGKDLRVILGAIEAGEEFADKRYREALARDLPSEIRALVARQHRGLQEKLSAVRQFKRSPRRR